MLEMTYIMLEKGRAEQELPVSTRTCELPRGWGGDFRGPSSYECPLWVAGSTGHCNTARSLSAGHLKPKVFLGGSFRRWAIRLRYA